MIFQMRDLASLLHEVGHVVANTFARSHPDILNRNNSSISKQISEILAELFSQSFCFGGNGDLHASCMEKILETYLPDPENRLTESTNLVYFTRLTAVGWLADRKWDSAHQRSQISKAFFSLVWDLVREDIPQDEEEGVSKTLKEIADAISILAKSYDTNAVFKAYVDAIQAITQPEYLKEIPGGPLILKFRNFLSEKESGDSVSTLSDDFQMLEKLVHG